MADDTLAAILAEMRDLVDRRAADAGGERPGIELLRSYASRIEAAAKREREEAKAYFEKLHDGPSMICTAKNCAVRNVGIALAAPGNVAAMREALMAVRGDLTSALHPNTSRAIIDAALAAPARNCDRFATAEEAYAAWQKLPNLASAFAWLFAPTEGGNHV